ncbi:MAG: prolyl oligopeptidase family serine peptidase, partial [Thermoguttaceae bacterium]
SKIIRPLTHHFYHHGYTRALYLANGDILLSGPEEFDPKNPHISRVQCYLYVLDKSLAKPPEPLGTKCSEGPAVSRKRMHIAWAQVADQYPDELAKGQSRMQEADIVYEHGAPKLANQKIIIESRDLPFKCTLEPQNFRPPEERELIFTAYGYQGTEVCGIDLVTKKVVNYSNAPGQYDEPEGIFPDGQYTCVECDRQNHKGSNYVDLWKLKLDGSSKMERMTFFSDYPGYKSSNPVVSDDGRYMAFQMAKSKDQAGVGYGIFIYDFTKAASGEQNQKPTGKELPGVKYLRDLEYARAGEKSLLLDLYLPEKSQRPLPLIIWIHGGAIQENKNKAARANPIAYVTPAAAPFLIVHGDQDPLVPLNQSQLLFDALKKAGVSVRLHII